MATAALGGLYPHPPGLVLSVDEAGVLHGSAVASLSLFISGGQAGSFRLDVMTIAACS